MAEVEKKVTKEQVDDIKDDVSCDSIDNDDLTPDEQSITWIRSKINLKDFNAYSDEEWNEEYEMTISDFLASPHITRLLIYRSNAKTIVFDTGLAPPPPSILSNKSNQMIQFFLKDPDVSLIKCKETRLSVQYGIISGNRLESLLSMMNKIYLPTILGNVSWPKSVQKDLSEKLHKFMAALTESVNHQKGKTVLYVPKETSIDGIDHLNTDSIQTLSNDTELVRRLESTLIHWTRQIEEMVKNQTMNGGETDDIGPLEEIEFWRARTIDLVSVREQLNKVGVKTIILILRASCSTYLERFDNLAGSIEFGSKEANENLKYLLTLKNPCYNLSTSEPNKIPLLLEDIILIIRMIWSTSTYYSTNDRLTSLLRKVSNQIIIQCSNVINLNEILSSSSNLNDAIKKQIQLLQDSEHCGKQWKRVYNQQKQILSKAEKNWNGVDPSSVFAQIDAFIQRCRDLLTVCNGQLQFCRNRNDEVLNSFGGAKGNLIIKSLFEIEDGFLKHIEKLKNLNYNILDVNTTKWHEDYTYFKNGIKDLEVMMSNIINNAFDGISTIEDGINLLSSFIELSKTESMKQNIERKLSELYQLSIESVLLIKKDFDKHHQNQIIINENLPKYGGAAMWVLGLRQRLAKQINHLKYSILLPVTKEKQEAIAIALQVYDVLNVFLKEKHLEFDNKINSMDLESGLDSRLNQPLLTPTTNTGLVKKDGISGHLVCNFDQDLLRIFRETETWEHYVNLSLYQVPFAARKMAENSPNLRLLRENVMLVVQDFNKIIDALSVSERKLFNEHMKRVEKRLGPGLAKYTWNKKYIKEVFVKKCRVECDYVYRIVTQYHLNQKTIKSECNKIKKLIMILIHKSSPQTVQQFKEKQLRYLRSCNNYLQLCWHNIHQSVSNIYKNFQGHPKDVQYEWRLIIKELNKNIENSLKYCIKSSLLEFSRAINGDNCGKSGGDNVNISPLFKVSMILDPRTSKINFTPSIVDLTQMVSTVSRSLLETSKNIERVKAGNATHDAHSIFDIISKEEEIIKSFVAIMEGISSVATEIGTLMTDFENKYKQLWDMDKDKFVLRMSNSKQPLEAFDKHITRYKEIEQDILHEETTYNVKFIHVNCNDLKKILVQHCKEWQSKLTNLLKKKSLDELNEILSFFDDNTATIQKQPKTHQDLGAMIKLNAQLYEECKDVPSRFAPLEKMFVTLEKFDVQIADENIKLLGSLGNKLEDFKSNLILSNDNLTKCKSSMRQSLQSELERFSHHVEKLRNEFIETGIKTAPMPTDGEPDIEWAFSVMKRFKKQISDDKETAKQIKIGLDIFGIEQPSYKDMNDTEKELKNLLIIWSLIKEWNHNKWNKWKSIQFKDVDVDVMEKESGEFYMRVMKLRKKMSEWEVWQVCKKTIENFQQILPLINDLKNPSMRPRHWMKLRAQSQGFEDVIDEENGFDMVSLDVLHELGIFKYGDVICDISGNANKEENIEKAIANLHSIWMNLEIDMVVYKEVYYKMGVTEELIQQLEDDQVQLSTMKNSPYFETFSTDIVSWIKTLSDIAETIDIVQQITKQWIYLESIFMGSDEIRRQLPTETASFTVVNKEWKVAMNEWNSIKIAKTVCLLDGQFDRFISMQKALEKIQRSLNDYLETKRMAFPRFYFLSDDDLLSILGHSKQPNKIQKHIKKLFAGIHQLILKEGITWQAVGFKDRLNEQALFITPVVIQGAVENWLLLVESAMKLALKKQLQITLSTIIVNPKKKRENWVRSSIGQLLILCGQISWTNECHKGLMDLAKGNKHALKKLKKQWKKYLDRLSLMIRNMGQQQGASNDNDADMNPKLLRNKLQSLITIEVHARDVIEKMMKSPTCTSVESFEWTSQLRFEYDKEGEEYGVAYALQTNCKFEYEYEYQGNNGRLVVTPLTDRCYLTLTTALNLHLGGSPQGPAGTGKTETVKDLGKAFGKYVVVFNCSDKLDQVTLGNWFAGLAQSGAWGCFDEFNRILIEVLSVVTQQIQCILKQIGTDCTSFNFEGKQISLNPNVGIFITMNPGYAGRTELPDNLKACFRPVAMMVPDSQMIAEVFLQSEGFTMARILAQKVCTLYNLMLQQFSKQDHYDFNLRAIISVLRRAGAIFREQEPNSNSSDGNNDSNNEELIVMRALKDMNLCKLVDADVKLFHGLFQDLFPNTQQNQINYGIFKKVIVSEIQKTGLQVTDSFIGKIIQIYEALSTRHGNMIVGSTNGGKTSSWKILKNVLCTLHTMDNGRYSQQYQAAEYHVLNPKAVTMERLYGFFDPATREWRDGILSTTLRRVSESSTEAWKWVVLDGPVDTLWIESMNTVLDDNKVLTLINGDRISLPPQVFLLFEVEDLAVASPATVSRVGIVYIDDSLLGWRPYFQTWINSEAVSNTLGSNGQERLTTLFEDYIDILLEFKRKECSELIPITDFNAVQSLCNLLSCSLQSENGVGPEYEEAEHLKMIEYWFVFCLVWSIGAGVIKEDRLKIDSFIRKQTSFSLPPLNTVYDYYINIEKKEWGFWKEMLSDEWRPLPNIDYHQILVPTVDTIRNNYVINRLQSFKHPVLCTGKTGTGKTAQVTDVLNNNLDSDADLSLICNFSCATTSEILQSILDSKLVKHHGDTFVPINGKSRMILFIDDLNMPSKDEFGSQPPLEFIRQLMEYSFWFNLEKCCVKNVNNTQLLCCMGPPGGSRAVISKRLQSKFNLLNFIFPDDEQIQLIFSTILNDKFLRENFDSTIKVNVDKITKSTLDLYKVVVENFLPTPSKCHYLFNLRDFSKVFSGLMLGNKTYCDSKDSLLKLWSHECMRIFYDRLINHKDKTMFIQHLDTILHDNFDSSWASLFEGKALPIFSSFHANEDTKIYQQVSEYKKLNEFIADKLSEYNFVPKNTSMNLVLFEEAIHSICHIHRIITQSRGNAVLVGVGGSGRQSLTKLATYIAGYKLQQIQVVKGYKKQTFYEDLKNIYMAALEEPTVFLFNDTQIVEPSFLEDINNILSSGEIPQLFPMDELVPVLDSLRPEYIKKYDDNAPTEQILYRYFIEKVRNNLHIVFCMSPIGGGFVNSIRLYPSLVNCTTIKWFNDWPETALKEVASHFLFDVAGVNKQMITDIIPSIFCYCHTAAIAQSKKMAENDDRYTYITPTNYLCLVSEYRKLLSLKKEEIETDANKLINGLSKIDEAKKQVSEMTVDLESMKVIVSKKQNECEKLLVQIISQKRDADEKKIKCEIEKNKTGKEETACRTLQADAQRDLDKALPALEAAVNALNSLSKDAVTEVKSYAKPPPIVISVMCAVMILLRQEPTWASAKKQLSDASFLLKLKEYDKDSISQSLLKKIKKYTKSAEFTYENVKSKSIAAAAMCNWVCAMEIYANVNREVEPKRLALRKAEKVLNEKQQTLRIILDELAAVELMVNNLQTQLNDSEKEKKDLETKSQELEDKLMRAGQLVEGLSGERVRWESTIKQYQRSIKNLVGDCIIASSFLSYFGAFDSEYRIELMNDIRDKIIEKKVIAISDKFNLSEFLSNPIDLRKWRICGLPSDDFCGDNGVLVTKGSRFSLMIDPQSQANKWIKNLYCGNLQIVDLKMDFMRVLEGALQFGTPVLLQDIEEDLDASLDPILLKKFIVSGNRKYLNINGKQIEFNSEFRLFMTTRLSNPHYSPEICTKTLVVNFAVKPKGLQDQLLSIIVQSEEPKLESDKSKLVISVAENKKKLLDLENSILDKLSAAKGSLLDDTQLIDTLQQSKETSIKVSESLRISQETEKNIDAARENYRPAAIRSSILYFVLTDLSKIDPMYQFSLESYVELFKKSIVNSRQSNDNNNDIEMDMDLDERIGILNDYHTKSVYDNTCRGLFEKHKLLFSFRMCIKALIEEQSKIDVSQYLFFLRGGIIINKPPNFPTNVNSEWLSDRAWEHIYCLSTQFAKIFGDLIDSINQNGRGWKQWYTDAQPEIARFPGDWDNKLNEFQRMIILRCLRPDRVVFAAKQFILNNLGRQFIEPPSLNLETVYSDSTALTPIIFILSSGSDPTQQLLSLSTKLKREIQTLSLGAGQDKPATAMLKNGVENGNWVFFANCHLSITWMPQLEQLLSNLFATKNKDSIHPNFRLWLSCKPHPKFPISILQRSLKITNEPPKTLRMNMKRLYNDNVSLLNENITRIATARAQDEFKKLLFCLVFFHSLLLERRKFDSLGWNIPYAFTQSDFKTSSLILCNTIAESHAGGQTIPWPALRYLISEVNYGGRITDNNDRKLVRVYVNSFFNEKCLKNTNYTLSELSTIYIPDDSKNSFKSYVEYIESLPIGDDHPGLFGQHPNADMSSHMKDTNILLDTLLSFERNTTTTSSSDSNQPVKSKEDIIFDICQQLLESMPSLFDIEEIQRKNASNESPLMVVMVQEIERYNLLLKTVSDSLLDLQKGMKGLISVSSELDDIANAVFNNKVPSKWKSISYPSLKSLPNWTKDLVLRCEQLSKWAQQGRPKVFWLSGFMFPSGFLTALLQSMARRQSIAIDNLKWEFDVIQNNVDDLNGENITAHPKEGAYIAGLYLEGAGWNHADGCLTNPIAMKLNTQMPVIHFKPIEKNTKKKQKEKKEEKSQHALYECPAYLYPIRTGTREKPSFVCNVSLKSGKQPPSFWAKRGTALLLALAD
eukprot:623003_1